MSEKDSLKDRVVQFQTMSLPGQPMGMHMGTSYLVNDLWRSNQELFEALEAVSSYIGGPSDGGDLEEPDDASIGLAFSMRIGDWRKMRQALDKAKGEGL